MMEFESDEAMLEHHMKRMARANEIAATIQKGATFPIPDITVVIMANDLAAGEEVIAAVKAGEMKAEDAKVMFGSFARMGGLLELQQAGFLTRDWLLDHWADEWPAADPDDTDPRFHEVWIEAWLRNHARPVYDQRPPRNKGLPRTKTIRVYRGQPPGAPIGCSWSLDRDIAERFARGAWARRPVAEGEIIEMDALRENVLAYLTGRNESEVILDPAGIVRV